MIIGSENFTAEVLKSEIPVLVDFYAEWCMPCKLVAPVIEQLATAYMGKLKVVKVDIDQTSDIVNKYNIRSVPTLMFFKGGEAVDQVVGAVPKHTLAEMIEKVI